MKKNIFKIIIYSLIAVVFIFIAVSAVASNISAAAIDTSIAENYSYNRTVQGYGIALRTETSVYSETEGQYRYLVADGERVAVGMQVAYYYTSEVNDIDLAEIDRITKQQLLLEKTLSSEVYQDTSILKKSVSELSLRYVTLVGEKKYAEASEVSDSLQVLFNKLDMNQNGREYYEAALAAVKSERDSIISRIGVEKEYAVSSEAGYFTSTYDGYEYVRTDGSSGVTVKLFDSVYSQPPLPRPQNYVGKTQNSPTWYFAAVFASSDVTQFTVDSTVELEFETNGRENKKYGFTVQSVSAPSDGRICIVFKSSLITADTFSIRKSNVKLVTNSYTGLRVPTDSLRVRDGVTGVYVVSGHRVVFKPVIVIYSDDGSESFSIVTASKTTGTRVLLANDEVVVGGKDLFDGKVIYID